jgi:nascent polypeptide-associated complex subunit alpha
VRSFQISGDSRERSVSGTAEAEPELVILDSDVELVAAQTGRTAEDAKAALLEAKGDLAAAIMSLASK